MFDDVEKRFEEILKAGLESQMRKEAKQEGMKNWKDAKIFPVVALVEEVQENPAVIGAILIGIPYEEGDCSMIMTAAPDDQLPTKLLEWCVEQNQKEGNYFENDYIELLFAYRRAVIAMDVELQYAQKHGWNKLMSEVLNGNRSTNRGKVVMGGADMVYNNIEGLEFIADLLDKLRGLTPMEQFAATFDVTDHIVMTDPTTDGGFDEDFKEGWI